MSTVTAVTHPGHHHGDEVLATWFLQQVFGDQLIVIRSDDRRVMQEADILYDCGGRYDPESWRFDHHSHARLPAPWEGRSCGYATAGLVWRHWGGGIIRDLMESYQGESWRGFMDVCEEERLEDLVQYLAQQMDEDIVAPIDAWDQGLRPERRNSGAFLPLQWLLSSLDFDSAVKAMGEMFLFRLKALLNNEGDIWKLRKDLMENGETEFYDTPSGILVVAGGSTRIDVNAARCVLWQELSLPCAGVVSPLRHGSRWVLFLVNQLPPHVKIPPTVEHLANRRCFYHSQKEVLQELAAMVSTPQVEACTGEGDPLSSQHVSPHNHQ